MSEQYIFTREGVDEIVTPERWGWGVIYKPTQEAAEAALKINRETGQPTEPEKDELHQFGHDGRFHQFGEIQWSRGVELFSMYRLDDMTKRHDILVTDDMKMFHVYKMVKPWYLSEYIKVYCYGWKIRGTDKEVYNFILPDDRTVQSSIPNVDLPNFDLARK